MYKECQYHYYKSIVLVEKLLKQYYVIILINKWVYINETVWENNFNRISKLPKRIK